MNLKNLFLLLFLGAALALGCLFSGKTIFGPPAQSRPSGEHILWKTSLPKSLLAAKAARRFLFVDFYAPWCGYCKQMDKTTYQNANLIRLSSHFECVRVDVDQNEELAKTFHIDGLPTLVFLNPRGAVVKRLEGYIPPPNLIAAMLEVRGKVRDTSGSVPNRVGPRSGTLPEVSLTEAAKR